MLVIQLPVVQLFIVQKITDNVQNTFGTSIKIKSVKIDWWQRMVIQDLLVNDLQNDTIIYSKTLKINIENFNIQEKIFNIKELNLNQSSIKIYEDSLYRLNIQMFLDTLNQNGNKQSWKVSVRSIVFQNSSFRFDNSFAHNELDNVTDLNHLHLMNLNFKMYQLKIDNDTILFNLKDLSFIEKKGFNLTHLDSDFKIKKDILYFDQIKAKTAQSQVNARYLYFNFKKFKDFSTFSKSVKVRSDIQTSHFDFRDLSYFNQNLKNIDESFELRGQVNGKLSDFRFNKLNVKFRNHCEWVGNVHIKGLPELSNTIFNAEVLHLQVDIEDIRKVNLDPESSLSSFLKKEESKLLKNIIFQGTLIGKIEDFDIKGQFYLPYGQLNSEMKLSYIQDIFKWNGTITSNSFQFKNLFDTTYQLGSAVFDLNFDCQLQNGMVVGSISGFLDSIQFNDYYFKRISFKSKLDSLKSSGELDFKDGNLDAVCQFDVNKNVENSEINFITKLNYVNLGALGFDPSIDPIQLALQANGKIKLKKYKVQTLTVDCQDFSMFKFENRISYDSLLLKYSQNDTFKKYELINKDLYGHLEGVFELDQMKDYLKAASNQIFKKYNHECIDPDLKNTNFNIEFKTVSPQIIADFFKIPVTIDSLTILKGSLNLKDQIFKISGNLSDLSYNTFDFKKTNLIFYSSLDSFDFVADCNEFVIANKLKLINATAYSNTIGDTIKLYTQWKYPETNTSDGNASFSMYNYLNPTSQNTVYHLTGYSTELLIGNSNWKINDWTSTIDSTSISINQFQFENDNEKFSLDGTISDLQSDVLNARLSNINLTFINLLFDKLKFKFDGEATGNAVLSRRVGGNYFFSNIQLSNFKFNGQMIGNVRLYSDWDNQGQKMIYKLNSNQDEYQQLTLQGNYHPKSDQINMEIDYNNIDVNVLRPYLSGLFSHMGGLAYGYLEVSGTSNQSILNGLARTDSSYLHIDLLNTSYILRDATFEIKNNNIIFPNVTFYDLKGSKGILNGSIETNYFTDFKYKLNSVAQNLWVLNTSQTDNPYYYGSVFATGNVQLTGKNNDININIKALPNYNSKFNIPLNYRGEIREKEFIRFKSIQKEIIDSIEIKGTSVSNTINLNLNFDLELNPNVELALIFDPRIGDMITSKGKGNLKINVQPNGEIKMFGDYTAQTGDYLFTLGNVFNKRLNVKEGAKINWTGDPVNASVDLIAVYNARASLYNLFLEDREEYKRRIPVSCILNLQGKLLSPDITYNLEFPDLAEETASKIQQYINNQQELNKQFISVLMTNMFYPNNTIASNTTASAPSIREGFNTTSLEFLSNQFSNWISQWSKDVDIGFVYRPEEQQLNNRQLEVALSTQLLNDRVTFNGSLDVGLNNQSSVSPNAQNNNFAGDFQVEVKLTENGKWRLRVYNKFNDFTVYEQAPYTRGLGILYREEFNTFSELKSKLFSKPVENNVTKE